MPAQPVSLAMGDHGSQNVPLEARTRPSHRSRLGSLDEVRQSHREASRRLVRLEPVDHPLPRRSLLVDEVTVLAVRRAQEHSTHFASTWDRSETPPYPRCPPPIRRNGIRARDASIDQLPRGCTLSASAADSSFTLRITVGLTGFEPATP